MKLFKLSQSNPLFLPLACMVTIAMLVISESSYWQSIGKLDDLGAMGEAQNSIQALQQGILDSETSQRGYLLTDRKEYLQPYAVAHKNIDAALKKLDAYYEKKSVPQDILMQLREATATKLSELAETIRLHDTGQRKSAIDLVLSDAGKIKMESIRDLGEKLLAIENMNITHSRVRIYSSLRVYRIVIAALSVVSMLALFIYLRQAFILKKHQLELQHATQVERDQFETQVKYRTAQLAELTRHLLTAREDERSRLARNLHDDLGALLTSAKLDTARIRSRLIDSKPETLELLTHLVGTLNSSIALGRDIIENLRPSALSNLGLVATLNIFVRDFAEHSGIEIHSTLVPVQLDAAVELTAYRLVQEAITNISKYARAKQVWVTLSSDTQWAQVSVRDDGVGFDTNDKTNSKYGLLGMRFRVEAEGGTLGIVSAPGQGTLIQAKLPLASRQSLP